MSQQEDRTVWFIGDELAGPAEPTGWPRFFSRTRLLGGGLAVAGVLCWLELAGSGTPAVVMFYRSVVFAILCALLAGISISRRSIGAAVLLLLVYGIAFATERFPPSALRVALVLQTVVISGYWVLARRSLAWLGMSVSLTAVLVVLLMPIVWYGEPTSLRAVRSRYPAESLEDRLAYEEWARPDKPHAASLESAVLLDQLDRDWGEESMRVRKLGKIHGAYVDRFGATPGFGVSRTRTASYVWDPLEVPKIEVKPVRPLDPDMTRLDQDQIWPATMIETSVAAYRPALDQMASPWVHFPLSPDKRIDGFDYHFAATKDFLNPASFGFVNRAGEVAGFVEHAFHNAPPAMQHRQRVWALQELKLVSLLQFAEPRVYELDELPRMDEISSMTVPTRSLNGFETAAMQELRQGRETHLREFGNRLQMMGALRARSQCLECHNTRHGELLGAFTYTFESRQMDSQDLDNWLTEK